MGSAPRPNFFSAVLLKMGTVCAYPVITRAARDKVNTMQRAGNKNRYEDVKFLSKNPLMRGFLIRGPSFIALDPGPGVG